MTTFTRWTVMTLQLSGEPVPPPPPVPGARHCRPLGEIAGDDAMALAWDALHAPAPLSAPDPCRRRRRRRKP